MKRMSRALLIILVGGACLGLAVFHRSGVVSRAQARLRPVDYFAPAKQGSAPPVAWLRSIDTGVGGSLVTDGAGDVYLWYDTDSHVLKFDQRGKRLWDKRFVPLNQNGWCTIVPNPKGELFMSQQIRDHRVFSRLVPNGTLRARRYLPRSAAMVANWSAVDVRGGWVLTEIRNDASEGPGGQQYLSRYAPDGRREWSTYLSDVQAPGLDYMNAPPPTSMPQVVDIDVQGNSYVILGDAKSLPRESGRGLVNCKLTKFSPNGQIAWKMAISSGLDTVIAMQVDSAGNVYITGQHEALGYYLAKISPSGKWVWQRQPMSATGEVAQTLLVDISGNTYIAGGVPQGDQDSAEAIFLAKHDKSGRLLWCEVVPRITMFTGLAIYDSRAYVSGVVAGTPEMYLVGFGK